MKKKAFVLGICSYPTAPLKGCENDAAAFAHFLSRDYGFRQEDVRLLTGNAANKKAIVERLKWLAQSEPGDQCVFYYSGHGVRLASRDPETGAIASFYEAICPVEFDGSPNSAITDQELFELLGRIPPGASLTWVSDSCHSADQWLPGDPEDRRRRFPLPPDLAWRSQAGYRNQSKAYPLFRNEYSCDVAFLAGCGANQISIERPFPVGGGLEQWRGVFTHHLFTRLCAEGGDRLPLNAIVEQVKSSLREAEIDQVPYLEGTPNLLQQPFLF